MKKSLTKSSLEAGLRVQVVTLGCSKNRVDSEHLLIQLQSAGFQISPEGEDLTDGKVDIVILNTCGFIKDAKEESIEAILLAVDAKENGYISKVYVFGCLSQRYGAELKEEISQVDGFFGAFQVDPLLSALGVKRDLKLETRRLLTTPSHFAYLKISEGCNRTCSYCAIPGIRGAHISVPMEQLVAEAKELAAQGVKELIVIAQDTTYYGIDLYKKRTLAKLLERIALIEGIEWIRLHYSYPASFPEDVLDFMGSCDKMCKYLDIPLQHSSDKVLAAMRRNVDGKGTRKLVETIRKKVPGVVLRTTMIVGHPGEGRREFENLLSFVRDYRFERLGAFTYSEEEGTWGANNLKDSIRESTKQARYEELMELQSQISLDYNVSRIGSCEKVLIDSFSDGVFTARSSKESPEVDGEVLIGGVANMPIIGTFADVVVKSANEYDLLAEFKN